MAETTRRPILISGAGVASLLLGRALRRANIPFQIFEQDKSQTFRAQGYRLRLSPEGLDAIETCLGPEGWPTFWDACGKTGGAAGGVRALDARTGGEIPFVAPQSKSDDQGGKRTLNPLTAIGAKNGKVVGISRGEMRQIFMLGIESNIQWAHHVTSYELTPSGVRVIFSDGSTSVEGDMLIAGDGLKSQVAKQLSQGRLKVYDTGARGIHGQAPTAAYKGLGEGVWRMVDENNETGKVSVITNVRPNDMDDPNVSFGWTMAARPGVIRAPNDDYTIIGAPAAEIAKSLTKEWHPRFKPLFDEMDIPEAAFWKITCSTPEGVPEWPNEPRITVIGDAVHSMTPAGGIGANTAARDSALLGRLLAEAGGYADGVTAAYEKEMRVYGSEAVRESYKAATTQFGITIDENTATF